MSTRKTTQKRPAAKKAAARKVVLKARKGGPGAEGGRSGTQGSAQGTQGLQRRRARRQGLRGGHPSRPSSAPLHLPTTLNTAPICLMLLSKVREQERRSMLHLKRMTDYAYTKRCRRAFILQYFGTRAPGAG